MIIPIGNIESNQDVTKSGITVSSLKNENVPNPSIIKLTKIATIMATNMPPAPNSLKLNEAVAPELVNLGLISIKNKATDVNPAIILCFFNFLNSI